MGPSDKGSKHIRESIDFFPTEIILFTMIFSKGASCFSAKFQDIKFEVMTLTAYGVKNVFGCVGGYKGGRHQIKVMSRFSFF